MIRITIQFNMYKMQVTNQKIKLLFIIIHALEKVLETLSDDTSSASQPMKIEFEARTKRVDQFCEVWKQNRNVINFNLDNLLILKERNLLWCPVYKAGTSTWMRYLVELSHLPLRYKKTIIDQNPNSCLILGRKVAPSISTSNWKHISKDYIKETIRFIIVRHPFERLVSAFRDKIERWNDKNERQYGNKFGRYIVELYRDEYIAKFGRESLNESNNLGAILPLNSGSRTEKLPTFWEFVQWFTNHQGSNQDEHWIPIIDYCSVCALKYDYILKFEDYKEENLEFLQQADLLKYFPNKNILTQKVNENRPGKLTSLEITKLYFDVLSNEDVEKLYKIYESDFKLFGYTFQFRNLTFPRLYI